MKIILKRLIAITLFGLLFVCSTLTATAAVENGKITVFLEDKEKNALNGMEIKACQIASIDNGKYCPTEAFENSGISVSGIVGNQNETSAKTIVDYIKKNNLAAKSEVSENGKAIFAELELGIWLVYSEGSETYAFNPYIVFLPYESGGKLYYELKSTPKIQEIGPNEINVYVMKKWDDKNNASKNRPESITVEILNGDNVVGSAELSEANGWSHTFLRLAKDGNYSVREKEVANYKASYSGDAINGFIVVNTYSGEKLPMTGQYWWPIVIIGVAGAGFILLGIYEVGVKKNGKKK